ncbi:MAG TPA: LysR family transcriptional regulator [Cellvibrionaceae bacterium]|nr:LysR family transcriptional regulator [Cellvibrionaceae bacterium]HMW47410.1 LysR family transcriptional regulator [Cellvibrionaceae bacterium]HMW71106.1 LysR family transcriptional regulator [Cellvibrionaceae bacterium]HNG60953.1 LysR family transcriptional regulator [Cellvibrionaceae bacterium]
MNTSISSLQFDWTLIRSFLAVMDEGNLQAAAARLHSTQPTISRHIATLEQQLGSRLFDRRARQLSPTALAVNIALHARDMESNANAISRALVAQNDNLITQVRISASQCTSCYILPPILKMLRAQEPGIAIELISSNHYVSLQKLEADIAVRMARPQEECLVARRLGQVNIGAYAHKNYLAERGTPKTAADLMQHDLIGYDQQLSILKGLQQWGLAIERAQFSLRTDDHMMVWQAIHQGLGVGFTAHYVARRDPDVLPLLTHLPVEPMEVWLTLHEDLRTSVGIRRVFNCLAEHLTERLALEAKIDQTLNAAHI